MTNDMRGDLTLEIAGKPQRLRLTLGALAEIEEALEADGLLDLTARLAKPKLSDFLVILSIMSGAAGHPVAVETLKRSDINLGEAIRVVTTAFQEALGAGQARGKSAAPNGAQDLPSGSD